VEVDGSIVAVGAFAENGDIGEATVMSKRKIK
jgi:hypothetical protein